MFSTRAVVVAVAVTAAAAAVVVAVAWSSPFKGRIRRSLTRLVASADWRLLLVSMYITNGFSVFSVLFTLDVSWCFV
jgi:hypothetical protein